MGTLILISLILLCVQIPFIVSAAKDTFKLDSVYEANLGKTLAVIEELRYVLGTEGIECPGVLVVGAQSAGKSSVLERLTGISFPRGQNLCTRFPTIVQLQTKPGIASPYPNPALHLRTPMFPMNRSLTTRTTFWSIPHITNAIKRCSEKQGQDRTTVADHPVHVRNVRGSGPIMILIDLPGITHLDPLNTEFDIHAATKEIVEKYVQNENMIVLVVIPANNDFGNAVALQIAQSFDTAGQRTIGVISKSELVSNSSEIFQKIRMEREKDV